MFNTKTVEVDVDETIDKFDIEELIGDIEKELYIYTTKSMTLEDILRRLKELL